MKFHRNYLPPLFAALGIAAAAARLGLMHFGTDGKGLLIPGHPLQLLVWAITLAAAVLAVAAVFPLKGSQRYCDNFSASTPAAIGCFALAGGITVSVLLSGNTGLRLDLIRAVCGLAAIPALVWAGLNRWQGKRPFFLLHGLVCLYLTLYTVCHYQAWSSRPQIQDWFFSMMASVLLALFAYYQTAFGVSLGKRRMQLGTGLLAACFCIAAAAGGEDATLYLSGAVWTLTNLCSLTPVRRRKNPITETPGDDHHDAA